MKLVILGNDQTQMGIDPGDAPARAGDDGESYYYRWWMKIDSAFSWGAVTAEHVAFFLPALVACHGHVQGVLLVYHVLFVAMLSAALVVSFIIASHGDH